MIPMVSLAAPIVLSFPFQQAPIVPTAAAPELNRDLFGVCMARAGDLDADGVQDLWVGDPSMRTYQDVATACVWAVSGKTGLTIRKIPAPPTARGFGWTLTGLNDVDGDSVPDVAVGCEFFPDAQVETPRCEIGLTSPAGRCRVFVFSGARGTMLASIAGPAEALKIPWYSSGAGPALASVGDWNADGAGDFAIGWSFADTDAIDCGRVDVVSGKDGSTLRSWPGLEAFDRYGFTLAPLTDLDGDGLVDLAAGAVPDYDTEGGEAHPTLAAIRPGYVRVLSSKGGVLHTLRPTDGSRRFGLSLAPFPDADHDGVGDLLVGQPFFAEQSPAITVWSLKEGKLLRRIETPELDAWDGGWERKNVSPPSTVVDVSFGTRLLAVCDHDGDGLSDILATVPQAFCFVPAGVLSSSSGKPLGRIELSGLGFDYSHVGLAACVLGDVDADGSEDFAIAGASVRCGGCQGCVVTLSGKTLKRLSVTRRRDMAK